MGDTPDKEMLKTTELMNIKDDELNDTATDQKKRDDAHQSEDSEYEDDDAEEESGDESACS